MYVCVYVVGIYNRLTGVCNVHGARAEVAACGRALKNFFFASQRMQDEAQVQLRGRAKTRADMLLRHGTVIKLALMLSLGLWTASVALSFSYLVLCLPPTLSRYHCRHSRCSHLPCATSLNIAHTPRMLVCVRACGHLSEFMTHFMSANFLPSLDSDLLCCVCECVCLFGVCPSNVAIANQLQQGQSNIKYSCAIYELQT